MVKAQVAIEFFLMLALVLGLLTVARVSLESEREAQALLADALASKRFVDELTRYSRLALALNGSVLSARLYAPSGNANCFYAGGGALYCSLSGPATGDVLPPEENKVFGGEVAEFDLSGCRRPVSGWGDYSFSVDGYKVVIDC